MIIIDSYCQLLKTLFFDSWSMWFVPRHKDDEGPMDATRHTCEKEDMDLPEPDPLLNFIDGQTTQSCGASPSQPNGEPVNQILIQIFCIEWWTSQHCSRLMNPYQLESDECNGYVPYEYPTQDYEMDAFGDGLSDSPRKGMGECESSEAVVIGTPPPQTYWPDNQLGLESEQKPYAGYGVFTPALTELVPQLFHWFQVGKIGKQCSLILMLDQNIIFFYRWHSYIDTLPWEHSESHPFNDIALQFFSWSRWPRTLALLVMFQISNGKMHMRIWRASSNHEPFSMKRISHRFTSSNSFQLWSVLIFSYFILSFRVKQSGVCCAWWCFRCWCFFGSRCYFGWWQLLCGPGASCCMIQPFLWNEISMKYLEILCKHLCQVSALDTYANIFLQLSWNNLLFTLVLQEDPHDLLARFDAFCKTDAEISEHVESTVVGKGGPEPLSPTHPLSAATPKAKPTARAKTCAKGSKTPAPKAACKTQAKATCKAKAKPKAKATAKTPTRVRKTTAKAKAQPKTKAAKAKATTKKKDAVELKMHAVTKLRIEPV